MGTGDSDGGGDDSDDEGEDDEDDDDDDTSFIAAVPGSVGIRIDGLSNGTRNANDALLRTLGWEYLARR